MRGKVKQDNSGLWGLQPGIVAMPGLQGAAKAEGLGLRSFVGFGFRVRGTKPQAPGSELRSTPMNARLA